MKDIILQIILFIILFTIIFFCCNILDSCFSKFDERNQKTHDANIKSCFPKIYVDSIKIENVNYSICKSEPESKDFILKEKNE